MILYKALQTICFITFGAIFGDLQSQAAKKYVQLFKRKSTDPSTSNLQSKVRDPKRCRKYFIAKKLKFSFFLVYINLKVTSMCKSFPCLTYKFI